MTDSGGCQHKGDTQSSDLTNLYFIIKEGVADCISYKSTILGSHESKSRIHLTFCQDCFPPSLVSSRGSFGCRDIDSKSREIVHCDPHLRIKDLRQRYLDVNPGRFI